MGRVAIVVAVAAAMALATTACGSSTSDATPTATLDRTLPTNTSPNPTPTEPTTTTEPLSPEDEVEQAYLDITATYFRRLENPDPEDPTATENHSGENLKNIQDELETLQNKSLVARFPDEPPVPRIIETTFKDDGAATLRVCLVDDTQIINKKTGAVNNDQVSSRLINTGLKREDGRWKIASLNVLDRWQDGKGCDR